MHTIAESFAGQTFALFWLIRELDLDMTDEQLLGKKTLQQQSKLTGCVVISCCR
jgi:hypothetical protein